MMFSLLSGVLLAAFVPATHLTVQDGPPAAAAPVVASSSMPDAQPAISADEAALNVRMDAFRARLRQMGAEMATEARAAGPNRAGAAVDAVEARYRPEIDAITADIREFLDTHPDHSADWSETRIQAIPVAVSILKSQALMGARR